jgi:outer membrane lipoprotein SlyB
MRGLPALLMMLGAAACSPSYSPDSYATRAVQQANKVEQGVIVGRRPVKVSADGATGAATGAAAGGVVGSQTTSSGMSSALGAVGGALVGGLLGTAVERAAGDTTATEYIVRKSNGELVSVTQRDETPLPLWQRVLVIAGNQARIVPDYTVPEPAPEPAPSPEPVPAQKAEAPEPASAEAPTAEQYAPVQAPVMEQLAPVQAPAALEPPAAEPQP